MEKDEESFKPHISSTPIPTRRISLKEVKMNTSSLQCTKLSSLYHNTPNLQTVLSSVNQLIHFQVNFLFFFFLIFFLQLV